MVPFLLCSLLLAAPAGAEAAGDLHVLAVNGGGDRLDNFASHLEHLRQLVDVLAAAGVRKDHITVLASDGGAPAPDLAAREAEPENSWLLQGTRLEPLLRDLTKFENSALPGVDFRPATQAGLSRAIAKLRRRLRPGDTLLLYVTDHGTESRRDPIDNRITLWGPHETISVRGLGALLATLPAKARVVSLMSQCFSGGFAYLHEAREKSRLPGGGTCGYFSSTPDRPAYGCYPEVRREKAVGHSFEFLSAVARQGSFATAHAEVLESDDTPDIPLRSSDVYLAELLARHTPANQGDAAFADSFLRRALASGAGAAESQLVDRIASRYALARPASLVELDEQVRQLFARLDELDARARTWEIALGDFNRASLDAFLASRPVWRQRLAHQSVRRLDAPALRACALDLLAELFPFVAADGARLAEANRLVTGLATTDEIGYRTEIRVAVLLRMRFVLTSVAGHEWCKRHPREAQAVDALVRCEDLTLSLPPRSPRRAARTEAPKFPAPAEDERLAVSARPGWIGITFTPVSRGRRERLSLLGGAATITSVLPRSPAAEAGLRQGDIVLGAPGRAFVHVGDLRPFIAAAAPGTAVALEILRGGSHMVLSPTVRAAPP
ncbi:MAG: PDZ domain-containing protein [Deltaproteobacteria bacterium]|nr:PDZ domain-containing protein [Deltaproteobacteria bacterium]